ncbi:dual specificity protein phosphatase 3-like isoform X1 [Dermacentor variabilis]|uniref:dual specificity protein phosphatase 3-like isoform X1 n=2 Tax=Dermacentor variabilis TaxID=34621 RepID=UPI003F5B51AC
MTQRRVLTPMSFLGCDNNSFAMRGLHQILVEVKPELKPLPGVALLAKSHGIKVPPNDRYSYGVDCDEVYPGIYVGDEGAARNKHYLRGLGVTHVLNTAEGSQFGQVDTSQAFYNSHGISYLGLRLVDIPQEDIAAHFDKCANFIDDCLEHNGKVLVNCRMGMSRSATIAIAYLMIKKGMTVDDGLRTLRMNRAVRPNNGFLLQLVQLDAKLRS